MASFSISWSLAKLKSLRGSTSKNQKPKPEDDEAYLQELGVTHQLIDYVKGFTINTFKEYPLQDEHKGEQIDGSATNVNMDLSEWQEKHAMLVLSKVKEVSQLRYVLCPRHLKERQFWKIYFLLVKSLVEPYEIRALTKVKMRMLELQNEKSVDKAAIEVEMTDTKLSSASFAAWKSDSEPVEDEL